MICKEDSAVEGYDLASQSNQILTMWKKILPSKHQDPIAP